MSTDDIPIPIEVDEAILNQLEVEGRSLRLALVSTPHEAFSSVVMERIRQHPDVVLQRIQAELDRRRIEQMTFTMPSLQQLIDAKQDFRKSDFRKSLHLLLASYELDPVKPYVEMKELKKFRKSQAAPVKPLAHLSIPDRNDPCICGSGKKYKRCCGPRRA